MLHRPPPPSTTSFMSSKGRNFRRRGGDDADDESNDKGNIPISTNRLTPTPATRPQQQSSGTAAKPKKPAAPVPKRRLSFADDEEDSDETPIRPRLPPSNSRLSKPNNPSSSASSSLHKVTSAKDQNTLSAKRPPIPSNVRSQAGMYTPESLLELQKNTKTFASSKAKPPESAAPVEPVIVLKGLVKPGVVASPDAETEQSGEDSENDDVGFERKGNLLSNEREGVGVRMGSAGLRKKGLRGSDEDSGQIIMDQARIDAIKAKRERLRQAGPAAQDYIALDGGSNHGEAEGLSDEEPENRGRIEFLGLNIRGGKKGVFEHYKEGVAEKVVDDYGDDEDEDNLWEEEQTRKGLGKRLDDGIGREGSISSDGAGNNSVNVVQNAHRQKFGYSALGPSAYTSVQSSEVDATGLSIGGAVGGLPGFDALSISQQAEVTKKALYDNMRRLGETYGKTKASATRNEENLRASEAKVAILKNSLSAAGEKFLFMQKLREFVSLICDFLQHKAPYIEELEDQIQKLDEKRAAAILERRTADNSDEMRELEAAVSAAMSVFSKGGSSATVIEAATKAAQVAAAAARELKDLPVKLDDFGRDLNLQKRLDLKRRAEDRERRKAKSDLKRLSSMDIDSSDQPIEGESTTDDSDSESSAYQSNRDQLLQVSEQIFGDATEDFARLSAVVQIFEKWKTEYLSSYQDAYMSDSAPSLFSPYVRLELLKWDPLHGDSDFINMKWHSLLFDYGTPDDPDANLIPELVEKVAVPILRHHLSQCWDMFSTSETRNAVSATILGIGYVPASSSALGNLVAALRDRLTDAVANLMIPTWDMFVLKAVPNAARAAACRFGVSVRLMRNICLWNKILAMPVLEKLALDELLNGKVLPHLRSIQSNIHDAVSRSERIVAGLNGVWTGRGVAGDRSPKFQPLVDYLLALGRILEKRHVSGGTQTETAKLARRLKKMLVELNEYDHARVLSRKFELKEAL